MKKKLKKFHFRPHFYFETAKDFCLHLGISSRDIANLTGCHTKTASKWINNNSTPFWLLPFLYAVYGGVISCKAFRGWQLIDGILYTTGQRYGLTTSQVETYHWHLDLILSYQAEKRQSSVICRESQKKSNILYFSKYI